MAKTDRDLVAHLMRRAGFGATNDELDGLVDVPYEQIVDDLLHPERYPEVDDTLLRRYYLELNNPDTHATWQAHWIYRMVNTKRPLQEKIALFWHHVFATSIGKSEHTPSGVAQIETFRRNGLSDLRTIYIDLARDPAMLFWLDNCENHSGEPNENWGRELLELFSLGVGMDGEANYSEDDVKECARAFTGWTITNAIPRYPYGRYEAGFIYNPADHDEENKTFLGETGNFNGDDIVDLIARQPATARFISRHMYNFFVADDVQVPAWQNTPPRDMETIKMLEDEYFRSGFNIGSMLRVLFNSDAFKNARFTKVKSPAEAVIGTMRVVKDFTSPRPGLNNLAANIRYMGQDLMNPPTVEGWHTGGEWIDSGTLVERINFAADQVGNLDLPGVQDMVARVGSQGAATAEQVVDRCLELLGAYELADDTREQLIAHVGRGGDLVPGSAEFSQRVGQTLQLIVSTQEYQFA